MQEERKLQQSGGEDAFEVQILAHSCQLNLSLSPRLGLQSPPLTLPPFLFLRLCNKSYRFFSPLSLFFFFKKRPSNEDLRDFIITHHRKCPSAKTACPGEGALP